MPYRIILNPKTFLTKPLLKDGLQDSAEIMPQAPANRLLFYESMGSRADKLILPYRLFVEISVNTVGYSRRNQLLVIVLRHLLVFFRIAHESGCRTDVIRYLF